MSVKKLIDDCFEHAGRLLTHDEAISLLKSRLGRVTDVESVPIAAGVGRILAAAVQAPHPVPAHTNAAVDGYGFAHRAYDAGEGSILPVAGRAAAGHPFAGPVDPSKAVRIFTGAVMPDVLDTVAMQEDCVAEDGPSGPTVRIPPGLKKGANVRRAGEDVAAGTELMASGKIVRPQDLAALASVGAAAITCCRRLRIGVISTGDEIIPAGARALAPGEVYDANAPMLTALCSTAGAEVENLGIWPDRRDEIVRRLGDAAGRFDVLLTTGGASRGEEDHMGAALATLGQRHFWQIAVKPGRPMMLGQIKDTVVVGLPGNPVAVFVCFLMYVFPMLRALSGAPWPEPRRYRLPAAFEVPTRKPGRREFWRAMIVETPKGLAVDKFERDGSGLITGLRVADGLIDMPEHVGSVARGDFVSYIPFLEFGIVGR